MTLEDGTYSDPGGRQRNDKPCRQPRRGRSYAKGTAKRSDSHMSDILADYRAWRQQQAARVSTHSDGCHMWHKECMIHRLADALAVEQAKRTPAEGTRQQRCTLTDAEREAIEWALEEGVWSYGDPEDWTKAERLRAFLRGLLDRSDRT